MILVDSCVWIDLLRRQKSQAVERLEQIRLSQEAEICLNSIVYFEVLRGIRSDLDRKKVQKQFDKLQRCDPHPDGYSELVKLYREVQGHGVTVSKLGDWLIVKTLLDHQLSLLSSDKDFYRLQEFIPILMEPY